MQCIICFQFKLFKKDIKGGKSGGCGGSRTFDQAKFAAKASKLSPDPFKFFYKFIHSQDG